MGIVFSSAGILFMPVMIETRGCKFKTNKKLRKIKCSLEQGEQEVVHHLLDRPQSNKKVQCNSCCESSSSVQHSVSDNYQVKIFFYPFKMDLITSQKFKK